MSEREPDPGFNVVDRRRRGDGDDEASSRPAPPPVLESPRPHPPPPSPSVPTPSGVAAGGPGLGAMWGREQAVDMLTTAGFEDVRVEVLPHDPLNYYYVAIKPR